MKHDALRLRPRHRAWFYATLGFLFFSGVFWLVFHHYVRAHGEFGETASPVEPWFLKAHGAAAMVFLVVFGTLLPTHVRRGWHRKINRSSGVVFIALNVLLIATG